MQDTINTFIADILAIAAKNIYAHIQENGADDLDEEKLVEIMKGAQEESTESGEEDSERPVGLTDSQLEKIKSAFEGREDGQIVNVNTGACIKKAAKTHYTMGAFCGPKDKKVLVDWCHEHFETPDEDEEEEEIHVEEEETKEDDTADTADAEEEEDVEADEDDEPASEKPKSKGKKADSDKVLVPAAGKIEAFTQKKFDSLQKHLSSKDNKGKWYNAITQRPIKKTDANEKKMTFVAIKGKPAAGYAVVKEATKLIAYLKKNI